MVEVTKAREEEVELRKEEQHGMRSFLELWLQACGPPDVKTEARVATLVNEVLGDIL